MSVDDGYKSDWINHLRTLGVEIYEKDLRTQAWKFRLWIDCGEIYHNCARVLDVREINCDADGNLSFATERIPTDCGRVEWRLKLSKLDAPEFVRKFGGNYRILE